MKDGLQISAWYFGNPSFKSNKPLLLFAHGNGENLSTHFRSLYWILDHQIDFVVFDYRGYGRTKGKPTPKNTVQDTVQIIQFLQEKYPHRPLFLFGQSLGGAIILRAASELKKQVQVFQNVKGVIVDSTLDSYQSAGRNALSSFWLTWPFQWLSYILLSDQWAPRHHLCEISPWPLLIFHGDQDKTLSIDLGKSIYQNACEPKKLIVVNGGDHLESFLPKYKNNREALLNFIQMHSQK